MSSAILSVAETHGAHFASLEGSSVAFRHLNRNFEMFWGRHDNDMYVYLVYYWEGDAHPVHSHRFLNCTVADVVESLNKILCELEVCSQCSKLERNVVTAGEKRLCHDCVAANMISISDGARIICAICHEDVNTGKHTENRTGNCEHIFHTRCLNLYRRKRKRTESDDDECDEDTVRCPNCRCNFAWEEQ